MAILCKLTGHTLPYRCGDCRGFCIEQPGMTVQTLAKWFSDRHACPGGFYLGSIYCQSCKCEKPKTEPESRGRSANDRSTRRCRRSAAREIS
jgi:hypothetical protein